MTPGQLIKKARTDLGITQTQLAKDLCTKFQHVSSWERDTQLIPAKKLTKLSERLPKLDLEQLKSLIAEQKKPILEFISANMALMYSIYRFGYNFEEIARALNIDLGEVKQKISVLEKRMGFKTPEEAKQQIKTYFEKFDELNRKSVVQKSEFARA